jgi:hypothetical protein
VAHDYSEYCQRFAGLLRGLASAVFPGSESNGTDEFSFSLYLEFQISVFMSPRNKIDQIAPTLN